MGSVRPLRRLDVRLVPPVVLVAGLVGLASLAFPAAAASSVPGLEPRVPVLLALDPSGAAAFVLELARGDAVEVYADRSSADVALALTDPDGARLAEADQPYTAQGPERLLAVVPRGGAHRLEVRNAEDVPAVVRVTLVRVGPATDEDRSRIAAARLCAESRAALHVDAARQLDAARRARALADGTHDVPLRLLARRLEGEALSVASRGPEAEALWRETLAEARRAGDDAEEAELLSLLGQSASRAGLWDEASRLLADADALFDREGICEGLAATRNARALVQGRLGAFSHQVRLLEEALRITQASGAGQSFSLVVMNNLGRALSNLGDDERADAVLRQALWLNDAAYRNRYYEGGLLRNLAVVELKLGRDEAALATAERARALAAEEKHRSWEGYALAAKGTALLRQGRLAEAGTALGAGLAIARETGDAVLEIEVRSQGALAAARAGELARAVEEAREAALLVEAQRGKVSGEKRRAGVTARWFDPYELLVGLLARREASEAGRGYGREAFELLEGARSRGLTEAGRPTGAGGPTAREAELSATIARARLDRVALLARGEGGGRLATVTEGLAAAALALDEERAGRSGAADRERERPAVSLVEVQERLLDRETLLLSYLPAEPESLLFAVSKDRLDVFSLPSRRILEARVLRYRAALGAGGEPTAAAAGGGIPAHDSEPEEAARLGELLLGPLGPRVEGKTLVVVPGGVIESVPFAALRLPGGGGRLVESSRVVFVPSVGTLLGLRERGGRPRDGGTVTVFADPVFGPDDPRVQRSGVEQTAALAPPPPPLPVTVGGLRLLGGGAGTGPARLPYTGLEAEAIREIAGPTRTRVVSGFAASRDALLSAPLEGVDILHVASHAVSDASSPELSGIVLSLVGPDGTPRDGFVAYDDVARLRLPPALVVLSGCGTATGQSLRGEGMLGLSRAVLAAGARRVVATLWPVPDASTATLVGAFYEELLRCSLPPAEALRAAQRRLIASPRTRDPRFWAGFVLEGDWGEAAGGVPSR